LALDKGTPLGWVVQRSGVIIAIPILSGLHHHTSGYDFRKGHGEFLDQNRGFHPCVTAGRTLERRHCLPGLHQHRVEVTAASALPSDLHRQLDDRGGDPRQCLNALCPELAGADAASPSLYIRKRGEGELAVKAAFTEAILIRPAVMFGPDDAFLTTMLALLRRLPIYPMFGHGRTRLQPAYVEDVAEAIARALQRTQTHAITFECDGPYVYSYEELLRALARKANLKRILIPLPFAAWWALAWTAELLPNARHPQSSGADAGR